MKKQRGLQRWRTHVICIAAGTPSVFVRRCKRVSFARAFMAGWRRSGERKGDRGGIRSSCTRLGPVMVPLFVWQERKGHSRSSWTNMTESDKKIKWHDSPPPTSCSDLRSFPCSSPSPLLSTCHLLLCSVTGLEKAELYTIHRCVLSVSAASISKVN